jgi:Protein of unknown function (DUF3040)
MPLSEHEQKLLDQIEQALYAEDPKFASAVRSARAKSRTRRWVLLSIVGVILGLGLVLFGLVSKLVFVSVVGFVLILGSCVYAATSITGRASAPQASDAARAPKPRKAGVRTRMEDRLRRRFDEQ